jgi:hypothetical protein
MAKKNLKMARLTNTCFRLENASKLQNAPILDEDQLLVQRY